MTTDVIHHNGKDYNRRGKEIVSWMRSWDLSQLNPLNRVFEKFNKFSDWSYTTTGSPTIAEVTDGRGPFSTTALRFTTTAVAGQNASVTKNSVFNLNTLNGFWLMLDTNYRQTAVQIGITLYASHLANLASGSGRFSYANPVNSNAVSLQPYWVPKAGWSTLDGSPSWANDILSWRVRIDSGTAEIHDWELAGAFTGGGRPTVILTMDDGWASSYTIGHAEAQKRGLPLTHYLIASLLNTANYITSAQAATMLAAGDYLGLHGVARWDTNTALIASDAAALAALGIDTKHAAYPEGQIGYGTDWQATETALTAVGVETARLAGGASPTLRTVGDPLALTSYPLNNTMSLAQAKAAVDTAISSGGTVIFYGHKFDAAADSLTWVTSDWQSLLDYIKQKRIEGSLDVSTIAEWWEGQSSDATV